MVSLSVRAMEGPPLSEEKNRRRRLRQSASGGRADERMKCATIQCGQSVAAAFLTALSYPGRLWEMMVAWRSSEKRFGGAAQPESKSAGEVPVTKQQIHQTSAEADGQPNPGVFSQKVSFGIKK
jgi:hypothetical protein